MREPAADGVADRCPYPRPFAWDFNRCPGFMPSLHLPTDTHGRQLQAHWTCAHLEGRRREGGGFFPACALGSAAERARWATALQGDQLAAIRLARVELSRFIRPQLEHVRSVIGAGRDPLERPHRQQALEAWAGLVAAFAGFVREHSELFLAAGIDPVAIEECFAEAMHEFGGRQWAREWRMAESVVRRYPWPIVAFFRPDLVRDGAVVETTRPTSIARGA
ncbi:MAG TPA: hypothetical protein VIO62_17475 [Candidatus Dormibacteraeota bacterium]|jgi:hypothetical protein